MPASKEKKPDQVVFDQTTQKYSAAITPYATNLGAPAIIPEDITSWKNANIHKVNHQFKSQFDDLKASYDLMMEQFEYNNLYTAPVLALSLFWVKYIFCTEKTTMMFGSL